MMHMMIMMMAFPRFVAFCGRTVLATRIPCGHLHYLLLLFLMYAMSVSFVVVVAPIVVLPQVI
jgi:hypothetical protein